MRRLELCVRFSKDLAYHLVSRNLGNQDFNDQNQQDPTVHAVVTTLTLATLEVQPDLHAQIHISQQGDDKCKKLQQHAETNPNSCFKLDENGILRFGSRVCVPDDSKLKTLILSEAHESGYTLHPGEVKMYQDLKRHFWWPKMKREVAEFVAKCQVCQQVKADRQRSAGLLQPLKRVKEKCESITMDFVLGFPRTKGRIDGVWVIVDRLTKVARFIVIRSDVGGKELAELFLRQWCRLHGCPREIVSDRDGRFTSRFWNCFQESMGTKLRFSTAHHPQTDGQSERTIQTLEDMLRACALSFGGSWADHLHLTEFAYNNSHHASIGMPPYEALYGQPCRTPLWWKPKGIYIPTGPELVHESIEKTKLVLNRLKAAQERQKRYADIHRRPIEYSEGEHVWLKVSPVRGVFRFGVSGKLSPRYIGPFEVLQRIGTVAYELALPPNLDRVHPVFHVSQLRRYVHDPSHKLDHSGLQLGADLSYEERPIRILDRKERRLRNRTLRMVLVQWNRHSEKEATWEFEDDVRERFSEWFNVLGTPAVQGTERDF